MNRVLPKKGPEETEYVVTSIRMPKRLLLRVKAAAVKQRYTRNEALVKLIEWACNAFELEEINSPERSDLDASTKPPK